MSLIVPGDAKDTETRFVSMGFDAESKSIETQYIQSYKGVYVARFKVYEPKKRKIKLIDIPRDWIREMFP